jgi:hypothetical protein
MSSTELQAAANMHAVKVRGNMVIFSQTNQRFARVMILDVARLEYVVTELTYLTQMKRTWTELGPTMRVEDN